MAKSVLFNYLGLNFHLNEIGKVKGYLSHKDKEIETNERIPIYEMTEIRGM